MKRIAQTFAVFAVAAGLVTGLGAGRARAAFPDHPITVIIPFDAGGSTDVLARIVTKNMSATLGQNFIIENHPGAGGTIGMDYTARANPDGYTIVLVNVLAHVASVHFYAKVAYDPVTSFTPVGGMGDYPYILMVTPDFPAKDYPSFLKEVRANPGKYNGASAGIGSAPHLALELFKKTVGLDIVHVPYKGSGPALNDVMAGVVQMEFENAAAIQLIQAGKLRGIAVTGPQRLAALPNVPTFTELGQANYDVEGHEGFLAPAGTPRAVVDTLSNALTAAVKDPSVQQALIAQSIRPAPLNPDEFAAMVKSENDKWSKIIKDANIKP